MVRPYLALLGIVLFSTACAATSEVAAQDAPEIVAATDADIQARIEAAGAGAIFVSESDAPYTFVRSEHRAGDPAALTEALVRAHFASFVDGDPDADKPMSSLVSMTETWESWKAGSDASECTENTFPGPEECAATRRLNDALGRDLTDIQVFYFGAQGSEGQVDGTAVSVFILGRTPSGNYAGVRTLAIWT